MASGGLDNNPEAIIREKAKSLFRYAVDCGWSGPPFDPAILAGLLGIKIIPAEIHLEADAMIYPAGDGSMNILLNTSVQLPERRNFSICHEIAHTFFPDHSGFIQMRSKKTDNIDPNREVETLCDIAASELLLPGDYFLDNLRQYGISMRAVPQLSELFRASKTATIIKMTGSGLKVCAAVFLEEGFRKSENPLRDGAVPKMRVLYTITSPGFRYFIHRNKSVPDNSSVYRTIETNEITSGTEDWDIPANPVYLVEAMNLPPMGNDDKKKRAVALLFPAG